MLINKAIHNLSTSLFFASRLLFSQQKLSQTQVKPQQDSSPLSDVSNAAAFYRSSIGKVNMRGKTERGKFNEQSLKIIMKRAKPNDIKLLFEAYFNYLGHFTYVSNTVVDDLIMKALQLVDSNEDALEETANTILDIFKNHQYLNYYPHYATTLKVSSFFSQTNKISPFIHSLQNKVFIKLNAETIKATYGFINQWKDFVRFTKILCTRSNQGILEISKEELLSHIVEGTEKFDNIVVSKEHPEFRNFLNSFDIPSVDVSIAWLIASRRPLQSVKVLEKVKEGDSALTRYADAAKKLQKGEESLVQKISQLLESTVHRNLLK